MSLDVNDETKQWLREYLELDDQILQADATLKEIRNDIKTVKERHKELGEMITKFMQQRGIEEIPTSNGVIKMKETKRLAPMNKDNLLNLMSQKLGDQNKAEMLVNDVWASRTKTTSFKLQRMIQK